LEIILILGGSLLHRILMALLLCGTTTLLAGDGGSYKLKYDGGSLNDVKTGAGLNLRLSDNRIRIMEKGTEVLNLSPGSITELSYGLDVHRRVGAAIGLAVVSLGVGALMALTKSKKHYVGLTWDDGGRKGGVAFQADKNDYRGVLAGLEGVTGKKAVNSDAMNVKN
jgi:hypothetical protein